MPGVSATPIASYANVESIRVSHYRSSRCTGIPCAMVLTVYGVLTPERLGLVVSVTCGIPASLAPATWAPGRHALAVRARVARLAIQAASIAFHPAFVAIASRPSDGMERAHHGSDWGPAPGIIYENRKIFRWTSTAASAARRANHSAQNAGANILSRDGTRKSPFGTPSRRRDARSGTAARR
jgi:hypothetical protein